MRDSGPADGDLGHLAGDIANVEAVRAIKRLQHGWAHYAEAGDFVAMSQLFSRDGRIVLSPSAPSGTTGILDTIRESFLGRRKIMSSDTLNVVLMLSPVVTISAGGNHGKARWHEVRMTGQHGRSAHWSGGIHENEYVFEDGVWKIGSLVYHPQFGGSYHEGWRNVCDAVPLVPYHYSPADAGTPTPLNPGARTDAANPFELELRATALVDESMILNLQAAYGFYTDRKMWDDVADLFAPGGVLETGGQGAYVGSASIRRGLNRFGPAGLQHGELNEHLQLMPIVTLASDGRSAMLRGIEVTMRGAHGSDASWGVNICEAQFVKTAGTWKIAAMLFSPRMLADYDRGWASDLLAHPKASKRFPPDRPLEEATAYPANQGPPIAFAHPVIDACPATAPAREGGDVAAIRTALAIAKAHDAAENIANAYGYYIDEFQWDETADLFSAKGWKELSYIGTYIGRERIRKSLVSRYGRGGRRPGFLAIHQKTQPYVTVAPDGRSAQIRLKLFQFNSATNADASMILGLYEEQAIIENGVWKIHGMDLDYVILCGYAGGWTKVEPGASRRFAPSAEDVAKFAPDGPLRGLAYAPYPDIGPIGFHYTNPVSGREPAILFPWSDGRFDAPYF